MGAILHFCEKQVQNEQKHLQSNRCALKNAGEADPISVSNESKLKNQLFIARTYGKAIAAKRKNFRSLGSSVMKCENFDQFDQKKIDISDFSIKGILGSGSFGMVYLGCLKSSKGQQPTENYAIKRVNLWGFDSKRIEESAKFQKSVLKQLNHPFLVPLRFSFKDLVSAYLVMPCGMGGSIDSFISLSSENKGLRKNVKVRKFKELGEEGVRFVAANVVLGLEHLHSHNILYRDLKPQNVIVFEDGYCKLADFGLSKMLLPDESTNTEAGTVIYFAPEVVEGNYYSKLIDFWALGVFIYELTTFDSPFQESHIMMRNKFREIVQKAEKVRHWGNSEPSQQLKDLVNKLLRYTPSERLGAKGFDEIKSHPFFRGIDWQKLGRKEIVSPLLSIAKEHPIKVKVVPNNWKLKYFQSPQIDENEDWNFNSLSTLSIQH